jgi:hypothetical protein
MKIESFSLLFMSRNKWSPQLLVRRTRTFIFHGSCDPAGRQLKGTCTSTPRCLVNTLYHQKSGDLSHWSCCCMFSGSASTEVCSLFVWLVADGWC